MAATNLKAAARTQVVKELASAHGFTDCKIATVTTLDREAAYLSDWLKQNAHGEMSYLEHHFDLRIDPTKLVPGAKSVIVLSKNYFPPTTQPDGTLKISKYAYGRDYHRVIRKQMKHLLSAMQSRLGEIHGRGFVDSAPVMEKAWAQRSGLGWMGKHTNILTKKRGSFFFLAVLIVDIELDTDEPVTDHCGDCTACLDACPTNALTPYEIDASKCISYLTIELKKSDLPSEFQGKMDQWIFGCDVCQDVCPWNRFSTPHKEPDFGPREGIINRTESQWRELKLETFEALFAGSAVKRTGYEGLMRNIHLITDSTNGAPGEGSA